MGTTSPTTQVQERPSLAARHARVAVAALFFTNGALFANLLPRYPEIKETLDLSNAAFGAAVAAFPLGALIAGLSAGVLIRRFRSSRVAVVSTAVGALGFVAAGVAPSWTLLAVALFVTGAMDSITDVSQNSHGLRVQQLYGRSILNGLHAVWSMGAVLGGLMGAAIAEAGLPLGPHMVISAVLFTLVAVVAYRWMLTGPEPVEPEVHDAVVAPAVDAVTAGSEGDLNASRARGGLTLARIGILGALVVIAASGGIVEDAGSSWAAIYLSGPLGATVFVAGFGFIALQGLQFVGRILGDRLVDAFGQRAVARTGGIIVFVGMGLALLVPTVVGTIIGFGLAGLGVATLIPAAMHGADQIPGLAPGTGLTIVSWLLRVGFLVSPPLVGAVADATSLRVGLLIVPLAGLLVIVFAQVLETRKALAVSPQPSSVTAAPGAPAGR